jgi:hypothetical protein
MKQNRLFTDQLIVITGAAGFIGSNLVRHLNDIGYSNLLLVDNLGHTDKWKNLVGKKFVDLISIEEFFPYLQGREQEIEAFIHLGACTDTCETDGDWVIENNTRFSIALCEYAMTHEHRFIYASSAATYGDGSLGFVDDETKLESLRPKNLYAFSKHLFDLWLQREKLLDKVIDRAMRRKIWLSCGGYLYFDRTEAMYTIDVNSGRSQNSETNKAKNVEETLVRVNLEAAEEIARQIRLRNVGGLVICDFIDMRFKKNQRRVLDRLKDCLKEDTAKCSVLSMSEFGLVEMTRQRQRKSLSQTLLTDCPYCFGKGLIKNYESSSIEIERALKKLILSQKQYALKIKTHPKLSDFIHGEDKQYLCELAQKYNAHLEFTTDDSLHLNDFEFYSTINNEKLEA